MLGGAALMLETAGVACSQNFLNGENRVSLDFFGGTPGASPERLIHAFKQAFAYLRTVKGGELFIHPGLYDFGECSTARSIVLAEDLNDVVISAYGATFRLNTTKKCMPILFYFSNPNRVTLAGAHFNDIGYDADTEWRGMYCAKAEASRPCSGFSMVDCKVDGAVGFFQSQQQGGNRFLMEDIYLHGNVKNTYYGAGLTYVGENASVNLLCENVRRGCISYGLRNASIIIKMKHDADAPGSNGFISLICEGEARGNVEDVRINLEASGIARHSALVHFYHQSTESYGKMQNIAANVVLNDLRMSTSATSIFLFDHELPDTFIRKSTARGWDQITLSGRINGAFFGRVIHNPSVSTTAGTIYVDPVLVTRRDISRLARYFRIKST